MRKIPAVLAVLSLSAVGLAGCSLPGASDCARVSASNPDVTDLISVSGATDAVPQVDVYTPFHTTQTEFADVERGEGTAITSTGQLFVVDIALVSGETGETLVTTQYDGDPTRVATVDRWIRTFPTLDQALECATEGSRVVVALAPGDVEAETAASVGLAEDESAIAIVDLHKVYLPSADGAHVFNTGHGLPTVVRAPDGRPGIIVPGGEPPEEVVVQTVLRGSGPVVTGDVPVRVHYTGVTWAAREVFDTSWDDEPASMTLEGVIPGFAQALEGQTVGSQVMVVVPPDAGYGDQAQGAIPANSTLVFVIDILGLDAAPAQ